MITTVKSGSSRTSNGCPQRGMVAVASFGYNSEGSTEVFKRYPQGIEAARQPNTTRPAPAQGRTSFVRAITRPLMAVYSLVAGPPMTMRERNRQAINEAYGRNAASLTWFQRTLW